MKRLSLLLAGVALAGTISGLAAAPAQADPTWYNTCGPKINIRSGMSSITTQRTGRIYTHNTSYLEIRLNRGLKAGWGQTGIWWAKMDDEGGGIVHSGDLVQLNWSDYDYREKVNYCRDTATAAEPYALTWGINSVASGSSPWGRRVFSAWGANYTGALTAWAEHKPSTYEIVPSFVVSW